MADDRQDDGGHRRIANDVRPKRVGIYARVSTVGQEPENQLRELRQYAQARGWRIEAEYVDRGVSGSKDSRPALNKLMQAARKRQIDVVLCWKFDRFGRSTRHLVIALDEFRELGIAFVAQQDSVDTTTPMGRMAFALIAAVAEFERELIRERIFAGLNRAKAQGKRLGRPRKAVDADRVRELRRQGLSLRQIAREMAISKDAAARALGQAST